MNPKTLHGLYIKVRDEKAKRTRLYKENDVTMKETMDLIKKFTRHQLAILEYKTLNFGSAVGSVTVQEVESSTAKVSSGDDLYQWVLEDPPNRIHVLQARVASTKAVAFFEAGVPIPGVYLEKEFPVQFTGEKQ